MRSLLLALPVVCCLLTAGWERPITQRAFAPSSASPATADIVQHTCALHVSVNSHALERPMAFGQDAEANEVHWNFCPGGTMVACAVTPNTQGEPVITGILWPYGPK